MFAYKPSKSFTFIAILTFFLSLNFKANSQEIEPRNYTNIPEGFNALALAYSYSTGNVVTDAALPLQGLNISSNTPILAYVRTFNLFGCLSKIQYTLPYTFLNGEAKLNGIDTSGTRSGFNDSRLRFGINFFGSPALTLPEFQKYKQGTILGASLVTLIPTGQYFNDKIINLGSNRWGFKPEIGISGNVHNFFLEAYTGIWLFTKNTEYLKVNTLEQNPLYSFQFHVNYIFKNFMWAAVNIGYSNGGQTELNGVKNNDYQNNARIGLTFSSPITKNQSVKLQYHTAIETRRGSDYDIFALTYMYSWF